MISVKNIVLKPTACLQTKRGEVRIAYDAKRGIVYTHTIPYSENDERWNGEYVWKCEYHIYNWNGAEYYSIEALVDAINSRRKWKE